MARVNWRGITTDEESARCWEAAATDPLLDDILVKPIAGYGSYRDNTASGGTDNGGGHVDINFVGLTDEQCRRVELVFRLYGNYADWRPERRPDGTRYGWQNHLHVLRMDCADLSTDAKTQIGDYKAGYNGLPIGGRITKDDGPREYVTFRWLKVKAEMARARRIIPRSEWGFDGWLKGEAPPKIDPAERDEFFTHYNGGATGYKTGTGPVKAVHASHKANGWAGIGYGFLITVDGKIYEGRGFNHVGAHCPDHNRRGHSSQIYIGKGEHLTEAAVISQRWLYDQARKVSGRSLAKRGHRDGVATECPGAPAYAWVKAGMPAPPTRATTTTPATTAPQEDDDMPTAEEIARAVWASPAKNADGKATTRSSLMYWDYIHSGRAAAKAEQILQSIAELTGQVAGLNAALTQLAAAPEAQVDLAAVTAAAKAGAADAIKSITAQVTVIGEEGGEPTG